MPRRLVSLVVLACTACTLAPSSADDAPPASTRTTAGGGAGPIAPTPATARVTATAPRARPTLGDPANAARVVRAQVAAAVDAGVATDRPTHARADQRVTLYAVITAEHAGARTHYSDAPALRLGGKRVVAQPLARAPVIELRWNRIEPAAANISNGATPAEFHFEPIDYRATPLDAAAGAPAIVADVRPTLTPDHGGGVGTMRYQVVALQGDRVIASAGPEARRGRGAGGLTDAVLRVSIRRDDTYLGYLTEMFGQPYIWASAGITDATHQSERLEGSDCADFLVYGKRRMGARYAYTWSGGMPDITRLIAAGTRAADGVYRDKRGEPLPFTRPGDVLLFPRHVGVLAVDRGTPGVLDDQDLMMHTLFDSPKEQAIAESGYADTRLELRRFR